MPEIAIALCLIAGMLAWIGRALNHIADALETRPEPKSLDPRRDQTKGDMETQKR